MIGHLGEHLGYWAELLLAVCDQRHLDVGDVATGVDANHWKISWVYLLKDLRVGEVGAAAFLEVSVLMLLLLRLSFIVLCCNFVLASHLVGEIRNRRVARKQPDVGYNYSLGY